MEKDQLEPYRELRLPREIKAFGDPLRLRIVHLLIERPATNQQVAASLGEPPAKVHHHICSLVDAGLIRLVETRISGKNVEKFYRAVARTFILRPAADDLPETQIETLGAALEHVRLDALDSAAAWDDDPPRLLRRAGHLSSQQLDDFHQRLHRLIEEYWGMAKEQDHSVPKRVLTVLTCRAAPGLPDTPRETSES